MQNLVKMVATFFGVGFIPMIPATWASAVAAVLAWFFPESWLIVLLTVFSVAGLLICRPAQTALNSKDPKAFVMDEVCGMMLSVLWLPKSMSLYFCAFILFRVLDVWKPWPISRIQASRHPSSIMWDDLLAGVAANLILRLFLWITVKI